MEKYANIGGEITSQGVLALNSLKKYSEEKIGKLLIADQSNVFLMAKYKRMPMNNKMNRKMIKLPAPDRNALNTSICLIVPDFDLSNQAAREADVDRQSREWENHLAVKFGIKRGEHYAKILTMKQMEREYGPQPYRKKLADSYDIFMVDRKLMLKVMHFMGKHFFRSTKRPLPFNSCRGDLTKCLEWAYKVSQIVFTSLMDSVKVRIGNLMNQSVDQLQSNLDAITKVLFEHCPGGPVNIRSCYIDSMDASLPIYVDFGSPNDVKSLKKQKPPKIPTVVEECTTLPDGLAARVRADGKVSVVEVKSGQEVVYPTEQDEWEKGDDIKPLSQETVDAIMRKANRRKGKKKRQSTDEPTKEEEMDEGKNEEETMSEEKQEKKAKRKHKKKQSTDEPKEEEKNEEETMTEESEEKQKRRGEKKAKRKHKKQSTDETKEEETKEEGKNEESEKKAKRKRKNDP